MITYAVSSTCTALASWSSRLPEIAASTTETQTAQPRCNEGIAAI
jgi:hypothetical protein